MSFIIKLDGGIFGLRKVQVILGFDFSFVSKQFIIEQHIFFRTILINETM